MKNYRADKELQRIHRAKVQCKVRQNLFQSENGITKCITEP